MRPVFRDVDVVAQKAEIFPIERARVAIPVDDERQPPTIDVRATSCGSSHDSDTSANQLPPRGPVRVRSRRLAHLRRPVAEGPRWRKPANQRALASASYAGASRRIARKRSLS